MERIKIHDERDGTYVELPRTRDIKVKGETVCREFTMADGSLVQDIVGFRLSFYATYDYLEQDVIMRLHKVLRRGGFHKVDHPDVEGGKTGIYKISIPESGIYRFKDGRAYWCGAQLEFVAKEVE